MKTNANKKKAVRASAIKEYFAEQPWIVPSLVFIAILAVVVTLSLTVPHNKQAVVTAVGQDCVIVAYQNNAINSTVVAKVETETPEQYNVGDTVSIRLRGARNSLLTIIPCHGVYINTFPTLGALHTVRPNMQLDG